MIARCRCQCHETEPRSPEEAAWRQRQQEARKQLEAEIREGLITREDLTRILQQWRWFGPRAWGFIPRPEQAV